jgi:uncharacterized membrane protein
METLSLAARQEHWVNKMPKWLLVYLSIAFVISFLCTSMIAYAVYSGDEITIGNSSVGTSLLTIRHNNTGTTEFDIARGSGTLGRGSPSAPGLSLSSDSLSTRLGAILFPVALSIVFVVMILNNKDGYGNRTINAKGILVCGIIAVITFMIVGVIWHGI